MSKWNCDITKDSHPSLKRYWSGLLTLLFTDSRDTWNQSDSQVQVKLCLSETRDLFHSRSLQSAWDDVITSFHTTGYRKAATTLSSYILPLLNHKMKKKNGLTIKTLNKSIEFVSVITVMVTKQLVLLLVSIN